MSPLRRTINRLKLWLLCSLICCLVPQHALARNILVVLSDFSPSYNQVLTAIQQYTKVRPRVATLDQIKVSDSQTEIILAVGSRACERMLSLYYPNTHLICTFLPSATFQRLKSKLLPRNSHAAVSAIFIDQPLSRQVRLARLIAPDARVLGSALGENNLDLRHELRRSARSEDFTLSLVELAQKDNPVERLTPVIEHSDLFLVIPDSSVFNRAVSKWLLYLSLRHKVPVIGFSASYTNAGATASVHSSPEQIGRQSAEWVNRLLQGQAIPSVSYPYYFDISVNPIAARTLDIGPLSPETLKMELTRLEVGH